MCATIHSVVQCVLFLIPKPCNEIYNPNGEVISLVNSAQLPSGGDEIDGIIFIEKLRIEPESELPTTKLQNIMVGSPFFNA